MQSSQCDLNSLVTSITSVHLQTSITKSKYMLFSLCPAMLPNYPSLLLSNEPIEQVSSFCYLGLLFTSKLSWTDHILSIVKNPVASSYTGTFTNPVHHHHFYHCTSLLSDLSLNTPPSFRTLLLPILLYSSLLNTLP